MSETLEEQFNPQERVMFLLEDIKALLYLEQKSKTMLLSEIADLKTKLDYIIDVLSKPLNKQSDSSARHRERTWS